MARTFLTDIALPRDPVSPLQAATKQYVDAHGIMDCDDYDASTAPTAGQSILWVPASGKWAPRTITPSGIGAEASANKSLPGAYVPNGYAGVDGNGNVPSGLLVGASSSAYGIVRLAGGDLSGSAGAVTVPGKGSFEGLMDRAQYGDAVETFPRVLATGSSAIPTGVVGAVGLQMPYAGSVSTIKCATDSTALSGSGNLLLGIYTGTAVTALTSRATATITGAAISTYYTPALSATVSWNALDYLYFFFLFTGFTTPPRLRVLFGGGPGSGMQNPSTRLVATSSASGQTALPASPVNINSGYSGSGTPQWFAAA